MQQVSFKVTMQDLELEVRYQYHQAPLIFPLTKNPYTILTRIYKHIYLAIPKGCGFTLQNRGSGFVINDENHPNALEVRNDFNSIIVF